MPHLSSSSFPCEILRSHIVALLLAAADNLLLLPSSWTTYGILQRIIERRELIEPSNERQKCCDIPLFLAYLALKSPLPTRIYPPSPPNNVEDSLGVYFRSLYEGSKETTETKRRQLIIRVVYNTDQVEAIVNWNK